MEFGVRVSYAHFNAGAPLYEKQPRFDPTEPRLEGMAREAVMAAD